MLTRKCQKLIGKLLNYGDFNTRVTIVDSQCIERDENAWKEYFGDSIGGGIINNDVKYYHVSLFIFGKEFIPAQKFCKGTELIEAIWPIVKEADGVKIVLQEIKDPEQIEIFKEYGNTQRDAWINSPKRVWVIVKN